ncbi:MAG TPA: hypothetical protein VMW56_20985 [Candidatus Margulisiibacteriota bacterium]|nr:hypothetical protein [Candidatus Margulisiibacteriota bacterium]
MDVSLTGLVVAVLAVWRVTHLLAAEAGPEEIFVRLRAALGDGYWGSVFDCFNCLSVLIAVPFALAFGSSWFEHLLLWPALSGAACLLERIGPPAEVAPPVVFYEGDKEETHELLRRSTPRNDATDRR